MRWCHLGLGSVSDYRKIVLQIISFLFAFVGSVSDCKEIVLRIVSFLFVSVGVIFL